MAFFGFVVTTYKRFRTMETRYTRLARRIALDEAVPAGEAFPPMNPPAPKVEGTDAD